MNVLADVKQALGITGDYQDNTLNQYIAEVKAFLVDAGVAEANITSGIIARGVADLWNYGADLWNYGAGEGKLSSYFIMRASQLALKGSGSNGI